MANPAVYSDLNIIAAMALGDIVIDPFEPANLGTSSYDLRLGEWYYREQKPAQGLSPVVAFNPYSASDVAAVWGLPQQAERTIWIAPGETILAHTAEFIGGRNHITTMMKARSSFGRCFIEVCKCAGWGDVGYINRWTMEVTNNSRYYRIPLVVGMRIAQMVFIETGEIADRDKQYGSTGKYQAGLDLDKLKREWEPSTMLPRLHLDRELR